MEANVPLATLTGNSRDNFSVEFSLVTGLWLQDHKGLTQGEDWRVISRPHIILKCFRLWLKLHELGRIAKCPILNKYFTG